MKLMIYGGSLDKNLKATEDRIWGLAYIKVGADPPRLSMAYMCVIWKVESCCGLLEIM